MQFVGGKGAEDFLLTFAGKMTAEETTAWLLVLLGDHRWRPGMKVLIDYTRAVPADFDGADIAGVAGGVFLDDERWGAARFAVVTDDPAIHGLTRMWQHATRSMHLETEVFSIREEASAWLAGHLGSGPRPQDGS